MTYTPGALAGQIVYIRTGAYIDNKGGLRTGVGCIHRPYRVGGSGHEEPHRWEAKPKSRSEGAGPAGALPAREARRSRALAVAAFRVCRTTR